MPKIQNRESAEKLARAIATDIKLYNEEKIHQAVNSGSSLPEALREELSEGRELYESRVDPALLNEGLFENAIDEIVFARKEAFVEQKTEPAFVEQQNIAPSGNFQAPPKKPQHVQNNFSDNVQSSTPAKKKPDIMIVALVIFIVLFVLSLIAYFMIY